MTVRLHPLHMCVWLKCAKKTFPSLPNFHGSGAGQLNSECLLTLVFVMAVPAGWGDETRRYVEDRISVNLQAFQVTYEQHVQTLVQEAVNTVKAFFDKAVQAMNDKADQVGRSTMQNEGMSNVQIARIDDAHSRLARLESASTSTFAAPIWSAGTSTRRDNIVSKKELVNVANFGTKSGPAYQDWVSDVKTAPEQVDELMVSCVPKQAKVVSEVRLTQNRRAKLQSELNNFKRTVPFDDLAIILPKWERKVRDLNFPQSGVTDKVKMDFLLKIIPISLQQFTSALISARG